MTIRSSGGSGNTLSTNTEFTEAEEVGGDDILFPVFRGNFWGVVPCWTSSGKTTRVLEFNEKNRLRGGGHHSSSSSALIIIDNVALFNRGNNVIVVFIEYSFSTFTISSILQKKCFLNLRGQGYQSTDQTFKSKSLSVTHLPMSRCERHVLFSCRVEQMSLHEQ